MKPGFEPTPKNHSSDRSPLDQGVSLWQCLFLTSNKVSHRPKGIPVRAGTSGWSRFVMLDCLTLYMFGFEEMRVFTHPKNLFFQKTLKVRYAVSAENRITIEFFLSFQWTLSWAVRIFLLQNYHFYQKGSFKNKIKNIWDAFFVNCKNAKCRSHLFPKHPKNIFFVSYFCVYS